MEIIKVEFLNNLEQTITFLQSFVKGTDEIKKLVFYREGKQVDVHPYERSFDDLDQVRRDYKQEFYDKADKITMVVKTPDDLITIHCDKQNSAVAVLGSKKEKKEELQDMTEKHEIEKIVRNDGCTYYQFEFGQIGKYDPNSGYYLYKDGQWEPSGSVMRWVEDPAYECTVIGGPDAIHK